MSEMNVVYQRRRHRPPEQNLNLKRKNNQQCALSNLQPPANTALLNALFQ
jgi:hypothetical protein